MRSLKSKLYLDNFIGSHIATKMDKDVYIWSGMVCLGGM